MVVEEGTFNTKFELVLFLFKFSLLLIFVFLQYITKTATPNKNIMDIIIIQTIIPVFNSPFFL